MRTASITEAKNGLSALIDLVKGGESVVITDRGVPVARLESAVGAAGTDSDDARLARLERAGIVRRPKRPLDQATIDLILNADPPRLPDGVSIVDIVVDERRDSR